MASYLAGKSEVQDFDCWLWSCRYSPEYYTMQDIKILLLRIFVRMRSQIRYAEDAIKILKGSLHARTDRTVQR